MIDINISDERGAMLCRCTTTCSDTGLTGTPSYVLCQAGLRETRMKSDESLMRDIEQELRWDPAVDDRRIAVWVINGMQRNCS
ncbi:hypothetical protein [Paraburkholderia graminis]|uniref:Uncharacterized protein n=1 Tax=Paraburkholderia graminis TaxID=60548 RepID=A0ABD5CHC0_9BURK|nr:hypothetical protein [Paraburkholderia graminis]MDR6203925.1 hypothetical protein [Paraburkholderia graminis]